MSIIMRVLTVAILLISLQDNVKAKNLTLIGAYNPPNHELLDIEIAGDYAYVPGGLGGLNILDVSNPAMPVAVASYQIAECNWGRTYAWTVDGSYAYGCGRECGIWILDVSDPAQPVGVGSYENVSKAYEHAVATGGYLFAAAHTDGIEVIDVSAPEDPTVLSFYPTENAWAVAIRDGLLYVTDGAGGLKIVDVTDPFQPRLKGGVETTGTAKARMLS